MARVLGGGAFVDYHGDVRCAYRDWGYPDNSFGFVGFREVLPAL